MVHIYTIELHKGYYVRVMINEESKLYTLYNNKNEYLTSSHDCFHFFGVASNHINLTLKEKTRIASY